VIYVLRAVEGIREFKVVQHELDRVEVLIVVDSKWTLASAAAIEHGLMARLGADVRVETRVVDSIVPEASGKHRYVVSRVNVAPVDELRRMATQSSVTRAGVH